MVTSKQIVEKMRDYRRTVTRSWNLFRESRIGLIGLAIMIAFTVMAVAAPFMNLKHPVEWTAPSVDILEAEPYFITPPNITGEVLYDVGIRTVSRSEGDGGANADDHMDRIYVGTADTVIAYSFNGYKRYTLELSGAVTTGINVINLGDTSSPAGEFHVIYVGCDDGSINAFVDNVYERDQFAAKNEMPASDETFIDVLDGPISSDVAVMNVEFKPVGLDVIDYLSRDRVFVGTESGTVYCFDWNLHQIWSTNLGNSSVTSVAVSDKLGIVVAGTENGLIYGMRVADGVSAWPNPYDVTTGISDRHIARNGSFRLGRRIRSHEDCQRARRGKAPETVYEPGWKPDIRHIRHGVSLCNKDAERPERADTVEFLRSWKHGEQRAVHRSTGLRPAHFVRICDSKQLQRNADEPGR
jgi:hypothetical protein